MTGISKETWKQRLPNLRQEIIDYLNIDPASVPVPVEPGIHYFMGGIDVDAGHRTNLTNLYAAGECSSQYHGANRLGGNSLLGAIYGGMTAADSLIQDGSLVGNICSKAEWKACVSNIDEEACVHIHASTELIEKIADILYNALGIVRDEATMQSALDELNELISANQDAFCNLPRLYLAQAMLLSAIDRKESRGAHYRSDFPERDEKYQRYIKKQYPAGRELS